MYQFQLHSEIVINKFLFCLVCGETKEENATRQTNKDTSKIDAICMQMINNITQWCYISYGKTCTQNLKSYDCN